MRVVEWPGVEPGEKDIELGLEKGEVLAVELLGLSLWEGDAILRQAW